jgi:predicted phosphoribosyltransferase
MVFIDRADAGQRLAERLRDYARQNAAAHTSILILALPRGGAPVAAEVARLLHCSLDVFVVRKLGVPGHEELAMGAIASGNVLLLNEEIIQSLKISTTAVEEVVARETQEVQRRERLYRHSRPPLEVMEKLIILIDDGLATGYTMRAAIAALRKRKPYKIVAAVPVAAQPTCEEIRKEADAVICLYVPFDFVAVGQWYRNFSQTTDEEVSNLLDEAASRFRRPVV